MTDIDPTTAGYERRDAHPGPILLFGASLAVLLAVSVGVAGALTGLFEERPQPAVHPMADLRQPPKGPVLQANPTAEIVEHRDRAQRLTEEYAWIDPTRDVIRVPVERAVELALERGFPTAEESGR